MIVDKPEYIDRKTNNQILFRERRRNHIEQTSCDGFQNNVKRGTI
jgi:hypothetical protein